MYPQRNRVAAALAENRVTLGSLTLLQEPAVGEILGSIGYDFLIIDMEHAGADEQSVLAMVRAAEAAGTTPLIRLRHAEEKEILWGLDTGAGGVVLPVVETAEQAARVADLSLYPPRGHRTLCSATRASGHGTMRGDFDTFLRWSNENVVTVGLIETEKGMANLSEILRTGIDVLMLGRADLSMDMGLGYQPQHPDVLAAAESMVEQTVAAGKHAGVLAYSVEEAHRWIDRGVRFVVFSQPEMLLSDIYRSAHAAILGDRR
jgi:2-keto-3-deoxy-L-rhamnonate aldolase RhmA